MTIEHPLRRALARLCSADTMARVVDPILADVRWERHSAWRAGAIVLRALIVQGIMSAPGTVRRLVRDDEHALPWAAVVGTVTVVLLTTLLVWIPLREGSMLSPWRSALLLAPQGLALTLPISLLLAIPVAFHRAASPRRVVIRGLALSAVCAVATFGVLTRIIPDANQTWREEVSAHLGRPIHLERGPNELPLQELRERIDRLRLTPGDARVARTLEHTYHMRFMLATIAVPLGIFAIAIALSIRGRIRSAIAGTGAIIAYVLVLFPLEFAGLQLMKRFEALPPAVVVWVPAVAFLIVASIALRRSARRAQAISA